MTQKQRAAIIGPGNIGTDLLMKAMRSDWIEPVWMVGIEDSPGIQRAREMGLKVSTDGVDGLLPHVRRMLRAPHLLWLSSGISENP